MDLDGWAGLPCSHSGQSCYPKRHTIHFFLFLKLVCPNPNTSQIRKDISKHGELFYGL